MKITPERRLLFERNFDKETFEKVKAPVMEILKKPKPFLKFREELQSIYEDVGYDYYDECIVARWDVELDRSQMETNADYVGVTFYLAYYDQEDWGELLDTELYTNEMTGEYIADPICFFDSQTYEITRWRYKGKIEFILDEKQ